MQKIKKISLSAAAIKVIFFVTLIAVFGLLAHQALAQVSLGLEYTSDINLGTRDIRSVIISIVNVILGLLGVIAVVLVLYGGYLYMTSQGEMDKIEKAKKLLLNAFIGLLIILSTYAIVRFLLQELGGATTDVPSSPTSEDDNFNGGALGGGVLEAVYPEPGATNVPRNTMIMVMFNEEMDVNTIIDASNRPSPQCDTVPPEIPCGYLAGDQIEPNVRIINRSDGDSILQKNEVIVTATQDHKSFVFDPISYLGDPNDFTSYTVNLSENILRVNGLDAFLAGGYSWSFQVSNILDLAPPQVTSVIPLQGQTVFMNAIVQINFNEPVNVVNATLPQNIALYYNNRATVVSGTLLISNLFRTAEFVSDELCPMPEGFTTNSCGLVPYCLPPLADLETLIKAALVNANHETTDLFSGLTDAAGNSLDGGSGNQNTSQDNFCEIDGSTVCNSSGQPDGRPQDSGNIDDQFNTATANDNYWWNFQTNDQLDLDPPDIIEVILNSGVQESLSPDDEETLVPKNWTVKAIFDEYIRSSTLNSDNYRVFNQDLCPVNSSCDNMDTTREWPAEISGCDYQTPGSCIYPRGGFAILKNNYATLETENHGTLTEVTKASLRTYSPYLDGLWRYNARITSNVQDMYQNCYFNPNINGLTGPPPEQGPEPESPPAFLHVSGQQVLDASGNPIVLKGFNTGGIPFASFRDLPELSLATINNFNEQNFTHFFSQNDMDNIKNMGGNVLRIQNYLQFWTVETADYQYNEGYLQTLEDVVNTAYSKGIYSIISLVDAGENNQHHQYHWDGAQLFNDNSLQDRVIAAW